MTTQEQTRDSVSRAYTEAVTRPAGSGCCTEPTPKGTVARLAGYTSEELRALPPDAAINAFGCGHPLAFSEVGEGDVVLDLGSGAGIDLLLAAKRVGPTGRVIGVDMTDEMIARARRNIEAAGLDNVDVRKGIIEGMPVEGSSVDWVISNCVINLSPEKPRVFAEIARVLKPGGRMRISDIVVEDLPDWVRQSDALYHSCVAGAIREADYIDGLRRAGLADVDVLSRQVYDASQLAALVESESPSAERVSACSGDSNRKPALSALADSVTGKGWSALFSARKSAQ